MTRVRRWLLPVLGGLLGLMTVLLWPAGPLWTRHTEAAGAHVLGFSADEERVTYLDNFYDGARYRRGTPISFVDCERRTGKELCRAQIALDADYQGFSTSKQHEHHRDHRLVLLYGVRPGEKALPGGDPSKAVCYLFDGNDGKQVGGPWDCTASAGGGASLSPDGRWVYLAGDSGGRVVAAATGKVVYSGHREEGAEFSPDGRTLALLVRGQQWQVFVVDLETGQEIQKHELTFGEGKRPMWAHLCGWDGQVLYVAVPSEVPQERGLEFTIHRFSLDKSGLKDLGPEPEHRVSFGGEESEPGVVQGDLVIHSLPGRAAWPDWFITCAEWVDEHCGTKWKANQMGKRAMAFYDRPSGRHLRTMVLDSFLGSCISPNNRIVAVVQGVPKPPDCVVQVWDLRPPSRWPWAVGAGVVVGALVTLIRRGVTRWKRRSPSAPETIAD